MAQLSPQAAGILGASKSINAFLRGQIQAQMIRQQREMQLATFGLQQQELKMQQEQLQDTQMRQSAVLKQSADQLAETIRANREQERIAREEIAGRKEVAQISAGGRMDRSLVMTPSQALTYQRTVAQQELDNFWMNPANREFDPTTGKYGAVKKNLQGNLRRLEYAASQEGVMESAATGWPHLFPSYQSPGGKSSIEDLSGLSDDASSAVQEIRETLDLEDQEIARRLQDAGVRMRVQQSLGVSDEVMNEIEDYYLNRSVQGGGTQGSAGPQK